MVRLRTSLPGVAVLVLALVTPSIYAQNTRTINKGPTTIMVPSTPGTDIVRGLELRPRIEEGEEADAAADLAARRAPASVYGKIGNRMFTRSIARAHGRGERWASRHYSRHNPLLVTSFDGIDHRDQRLANGGNQFSLEPPDQGLCVGNGYVLETVNGALNVYDRRGNSLLGVTDLNTFYGYPAAFQRPAGPFGPDLVDPSCVYDKQTRRWFHVILTIEVDPNTGAFTGPNRLDLAVSTTPNPLGTWNIYSLPAQNDGTEGTPDHDCAGGPCLGDYPHIGIDKYGVYLTTNEFAFFGPGFTGAQIYALPKQALASGAATVPVVHFNTADYLFEGNPGFTVWPAQPAGHGWFRHDDGMGTEFLLSSLAVFTESGVDNRLRIWALRNTRSLRSGTPDLRLVHNVVNTLQYAVPPPADQKPGPIPLAECINDTTLPTPFGPGCWQNLFVEEPAHNETLYDLDSNDSRMQQVFLANGKLYGALDTAVTVEGENKAGIAYFIIEPHIGWYGVSGRVRKQEILGLADNNLTYPAIAALDNGKGVIAFTVVGEDYYPSAGYVGVDDKRGAGRVQIAAPGIGPADGFSGYNAFSAPDPPRPRWGDYGAAAVDGYSIWIASEYINHSCTLAEYVAEPFGSCGDKRTALANWGTRVSRVIPGLEH